MTMDPTAVKIDGIRSLVEATAGLVQELRRQGGEPDPMMREILVSGAVANLTVAVHLLKSLEAHWQGVEAALEAAKASPLPADPPTDASTRILNRLERATSRDNLRSLWSEYYREDVQELQIGRAVVESRLKEAEGLLGKVGIVFKFVEDCQKNPLPPLHAPRDFQSEWLHENVKQMTVALKVELAAFLSRTTQPTAKETQT